MYKKNIFQIIIHLFVLLIFIVKISYSIDKQELMVDIGRGTSKVENTENDLDLIKNFSNINSAEKISLGLVGLVGTGVTFTLEVFGAAGAFWGATDVLQLRNDENNEAFRMTAMVIGGAAVIRYMSLYVLNPQKYQDYLAEINQVSWFGRIIKAFEFPMPAIRTALIEIFSKPVQNSPTYRGRYRD